MERLSHSYLSPLQNFFFFFLSKFVEKKRIWQIIFSTILNFFFKNLNRGQETLSKFADDTKPGQVLDTLKGKASFQRGLNKPEERDNSYQMYKVQQSQIQSPEAWTDWM